MFEHVGTNSSSVSLTAQSTSPLTTTTTTHTVSTTTTSAPISPALGFRTRPANVTVPLGEPAVFFCGVPRTHPNITFTLYGSHRNYSLTCPYGRVEDITQVTWWPPYSDIHHVYNHFTFIPCSVHLLRPSMEVVILSRRSHWLCGPSKERLSLTTAPESYVGSLITPMHLLLFYMLMVKKLLSHFSITVS